MDKKNQQSKAQFGTLTAKHDANQDYASSTAGSTQGAGGASGTGGSMGSSASGAGTLTAKFDANNDYGGNSGAQSAQSGQQKVKTADKNIK